MNYSIIIKRLREHLIVSQSELATILNVSFSSVNRWENGKYEPTIKIKRKIIALCGKHNINISAREDV